MDLKPADGFVLSVHPNALATLNGQPVQQNRLHNGDAIEVGALKLQFWLSEASQGGLRFREWLTWAGIAAVSLGQVGLVYWLLQS
ncbi:FHA domain containing protein (fragment) [Verrucomicrobia bacterium]